MAGKRAISLPERRRERFLDCQMQAIRLAIELTAALLLPLKRRLLTQNSGQIQFASKISRTGCIRGSPVPHSSRLRRAVQNLRVTSLESRAVRCCCPEEVRSSHSFWIASDFGHLTLRVRRESNSNNIPVSGIRSPESDTFERDKRCGMRVDCSVEVNSLVFCSLRNY